MTVTEPEAQHPVRIGVIGLGNIGRDHARRASQTPGATLGAVCDMNIEAVGQLAEELRCEAFNDVDAMLDSDAIDAAIIATPHTSHVELGLACLQAAVMFQLRRTLALRHGCSPSMARSSSEEPTLTRCASPNAYRTRKNEK